MPCPAVFLTSPAVTKLTPVMMGSEQVSSACLQQASFLSSTVNIILWLVVK